MISTTTYTRKKVIGIDNKGGFITGGDRSMGEYQVHMIKLQKILGDKLIDGGLDMVSGGTDTHLVLVDLRPKGITGNIAETSLERANITCNKNGVPFDPEKPMITSGIRLGSPACTSRGFDVSEFELVGSYISEVLDGLAANKDNNSEAEKRIEIMVQELCSKFPIYTNVIN